MAETPFKIKPTQNEVNYKKLLMRYLVQWKWIVFSTLVFGTFSYLYLKSQIDIFQSEARVLVKDEQKGGDPTQMDIFSDLGIGQSKVNVYNEIEAFTTRSLIREVVKKLDFQESLTKKRGILEKDFLYHDYAPIYSNLDQQFKHQLNQNIDFKFEITAPNKFDLTQLYSENGEKVEEELGTYSFDQSIPTHIGDITFYQNEKSVLSVNEVYILSIHTLDGATAELKKRISVSLLSKEVSILSIKCQGPITAQNNSIIAELIKQHEKRVINSKNEIALNTSNFINERMKLIEKELSGVEDTGEQFKTEKRIVNVESDAEELLAKESEIEKAIMEVSIQLMLVEYMNEFLQQSEEVNVLLPANLGFEDGGINSLTTEYNILVMERNRLAETSSSKNPKVMQLQSQIDAALANIKHSLNKLETRFQMELDVLKKQERQIKGRLANIPGFERQYREILRQQEIKEALYIYLLQKREENEIAMASTIGTVMLLDEPYPAGGVIAPKKLNIFVGAVGIGFALPILIIYLLSLLDTKVKSAEELEKLGLPYIGEIPFHDGAENLVAVKGERSPTGEALRMLRVNMNFMLTENEDKCKTIFLTSTIAGEGKTFTAINLASSIGLTEKKVVLLSLDLRKPKVSKYLGIDELPGVTDYAVNSQIQIKDIIQSLPQNPNLDIILSGAIPPNPSELLSSKKVEELFEALKKEYDYIIVDNAPVGLVSDVLTVMKHADLLLYVVRFGKLEKEALNIAKKLSEESKVKKMATVLNGTKKTASGYGGYGYGYSYGYGYGYGYTDTKKSPWYKRFRV